MKNHILYIILAVSLTLNVTGFMNIPALRSEAPAATVSVTNPDEQDWATFITALAWVESRWNDNAESPKEAVGYLQLTPILVKDANRIAGKELYSLDCRTDRNKSIEIFNVIMENYNPQHDMQYALKIWNPYAKVSYHRAVMKKYNELKSI